MRVFLDANILFSAAQPRSRMRAFLNVLLKQASCLTNEYALEEARRNLNAKFPGRTKELERLAKRFEIAGTLTFDLKEELPAKDIPILGGAIAAHATHLLTGDTRDFGKFYGRTIQGVKVVSPKILVEEMGLQ
jgi:predicted nucleic acid-binding protein